MKRTEVKGRGEERREEERREQNRREEKRREERRMEEERREGKRREVKRREGKGRDDQRREVKERKGREERRREEKRREEKTREEKKREEKRREEKTGRQNILLHMLVVFTEHTNPTPQRDLVNNWVQNARCSAVSVSVFVEWRTELPLFYAATNFKISNISRPRRETITFERNF